MKSTLTAIAQLALLLAPAGAQAGGKIDWKGKDTPSVMATLDAIVADHQPMMLFFTSEGSAECKQLSEGAFSNPRVVDASSRIACVFVECAFGKKNADLVKSLKITQYPSIVLFDSDGKPLGMVPSRDADGIVRALNELTQVAAHLPRFPEDPVGGLQEARKQSLPLVLYFYDDSPASQAVNRSLTDDELKSLRNKVIFCRFAMKKGSEFCAKCEVDRAPTILVLDSSLKIPESKPLARITGSRNPRELRRDLEEALAVPRGNSGPAATPVAAPAASAPKEDLSDDQLDRKFIQARIGIAIGLIKQGKNKGAIDVLQDVVQSYPRHVATQEAVKLLEQLNKK